MEQKHSSNFMGGLLLGIILGASMVFLLGTKKGKKILDALTEEGVEGFEELSELLEERIVEEEVPIKAKKTAVSQETVHSSPSPVEQVGTVTRRLFKGIPRRRSN